VGQRQLQFPLSFFLDKKERKNQALAARRPFTASRAKTAERASLKTAAVFTLPSA